MRALLPRIIEVYSQESPWSICKPTQRLFVAEAHFVPCQSTPFARRVGANRLPPDECALYGQLRCLRRAMFGLGRPRQPLRRHAARHGCRASSSRCTYDADTCARSTQLRPARTSAAWAATQPMKSAPIRNLSVLPIEVQLQLVRYDGLAGEILQLRA